MKKIVLSLLITGSLLATSCKEVKKGAADLKDATVETANDAADATKDAASTVVEGAKEAVDATKDAATTVVDGAKEAVDATKNAATNAVDATKEVVNNTVDNASNMVKSALDGVAIPAFKDKKVTEYLQSYATYAKDYMAKKGNALQATALAKKGADLLAKGKSIAANLDGEELAKYKSVFSAIQSKIKSAK